MSKYRETTDTINRICPYCQHSYQVEGEDYSEDSHVETCEACGKKYHARSSVTVDHYAKPDCELNGEKHRWETIFLHYDVPHDFCFVCDKCKNHIDV